MNEHTIDTIHPGDTATFTRKADEAWFDLFRQITDDGNPLHTDTAFAHEQGFRDRVLYGMCTASLYSTLAGVYLPGKYCLLEQVDTKFVKPVYADDVLTVTGTVAEVDERFARVLIRAEIHNQHGEKVSRAKITAGFTDRLNRVMTETENEPHNT